MVPGGAATQLLAQLRGTSPHSWLVVSLGHSAPSTHSHRLAQQSLHFQDWLLQCRKPRAARGAELLEVGPPQACPTALQPCSPLPTVPVRWLRGPPGPAGGRLPPSRPHGPLQSQEQLRGSHPRGLPPQAEPAPSLQGPQPGRARGPRDTAQHPGPGQGPQHQPQAGQRGVRTARHGLIYSHASGHCVWRPHGAARAWTCPPAPPPAPPCPSVSLPFHVGDTAGGGVGRGVHACTSMKINTNCSLPDLPSVPRILFLGPEGPCWAGKGQDRAWASQILIVGLSQPQSLPGC